MDSTPGGQLIDRATEPMFEAIKDEMPDVVTLSAVPGARLLRHPALHHPVFHPAPVPLTGVRYATDQGRLVSRSAMKAVTVPMMSGLRSIRR